MPCNLAISITKAAVSNDALQSLLTDAVVAVVVPVYLKEQYPQLAVQSVPTQGGVAFQVGTAVISIVRGQVTVTAPRGNDQLQRDLSTAIPELLGQAADMLFAQQVQAALAQMGSVQAQTVNVDNNGKAQQATVLTMRF